MKTIDKGSSSQEGTNNNNLYQAQQIINVNADQADNGLIQRVKNFFVGPLSLEIPLHTRYRALDDTPTLPEYVKWWEDYSEEQNDKWYHSFAIGILKAALLFFNFLSIAMVLVFLSTSSETFIAITTGDTSNINQLLEDEGVISENIPPKFQILYFIFFIGTVISIVPLFSFFTKYVTERYRRHFYLIEVDKKLKLLSEILLDLDGYSDLSNIDRMNYDNVNKLSYIYVRPNKKRNKLCLEALDPDWELEKVIMGFLPSINLYIFFAIIFSFVNLAYWGMEAWFDDSLNTRDKWLLFLLFSSIPLTYLIFRGRIYLRSVITYVKVKLLIQSSLTNQIIKLSTAETKIFSSETATLEEIDVKLDLTSARQSMRYLQLYSRFPYSHYFILFAKLVPVISIISLVMGPLIL